MASRLAPRTIGAGEIRGFRTSLPAASGTYLRCGRFHARLSHAVELPLVGAQELDLMTGWQADQAAVTRVYERVASIYDIYDGTMDFMGGASRRRRVVSRARGETLEVGIGTGRNLEYYPPGVALTGIDVSGRMLERARDRALRLGRRVRLMDGDVHALPFDDGEFDTVVATCVFCSVADPRRGLAEVRRVVRPNGIVLLLEHVRPDNPVLGRLADMVTPFSRRLLGPEMNRRTEATAARAGLDVLEVRRAVVWREMVCQRSSARDRSRS